MPKSDKQIIKRLQDKVKKLEAENAYFKSPMFKLELLESISNTYSVLLNPPQREFKTTTPSQKSTIFYIKPNEIICIKSEGKTKWIFFTKDQESQKGARLVSQKLSFTGKIEEFCKLYDKAKIHLCIISRSIAVNPALYFLDGKKVRLEDMGNNINGKCDSLPISQRFLEKFIEMRGTIDHIISFQKNHFRGQ